MELTERVHKLELGHHDHESRIKRVEHDNEEQAKSVQNFHDFIVATEAQAKGRDKTLKVMLAILTALSAVSTIVTVVASLK